MAVVRPAAVAGLFYSGDASELAADVDRRLEAARAQLERLAVPSGVPKALVLPHAGHRYSGDTAALGYALLARARETIRRVVLLGPTHRVAVDGAALPAATALATPLGVVPVPDLDPELRARLQLVDRADVHAREHCLEVHLPFLQQALHNVEVLPLAVGRLAPGPTADLIDALWGGPETVVVVSSDLSHFHPYEQAQVLDGGTVDQILTLDGPITHEQACGATPVNGLLLAARRRGLRPTLLGLCNSGDTAGDPTRVVGYAAVAFH